MRVELVLKRTSRDTNIRAFAIHARGEGRKNVYHGFARRYTTFPSPPSLLFHHFRSPRSRVPLSTGRRFPIREQGASFQRRCFAFTFPSPSSPLKQRRVALSPRSLCRARFLLSFACVLFDHSLRQLAPSFSFRSFLLSLDRNPFPPSGMIYPLEGRERKTWIASSSSMIGERINLLKLCFIKFCSGMVWKKWRLGMFLVRRWWFIEENALISFLPTFFARNFPENGNSRNREKLKECFNREPFQFVDDDLSLVSLRPRRRARLERGKGDGVGWNGNG